MAKGIQEDPYSLRNGADGELSIYLAKYIDTYKPKKQESNSQKVLEIVNNVTKLLNDNSMELVAWGSTTAYNKQLEKEGLTERLISLPQDKLIMVAGNTKTIWPTIKDSLEKSNHPFNEYS